MKYYFDNRNLISIEIYQKHIVFEKKKKAQYISGKNFSALNLLIQIINIQSDSRIKNASTKNVLILAFGTQSGSWFVDITYESWTVFFLPYIKILCCIEQKSQHVHEICLICFSLVHY